MDEAVSRFISGPLEKEILVKMDVQGYEAAVIAGAPKTLALAKACMVEIVNDDFYQGQPDFKTIFTLLDRLGFRYYGNLEQVKDHRDGHIIYYDAIFLR